MNPKNPDKAEIFKQVVSTIEKMLQSVRGEEAASESAILSETDIFSDLGIDSVEVMDLLCLIESDFDIKIEPEKAAGRRKVGDLVDLVFSNLKR